MDLNCCSSRGLGTPKAWTPQVLLTEIHRKDYAEPEMQRAALWEWWLSLEWCCLFSTIIYLEGKFASNKKQKKQEREKLLSKTKPKRQV